MTMEFDPAVHAQLVGVFVAEAEETLATLATACEQLRAGVEPETLATFGRSAHGLKGAAASIGMAQLAHALHQLEDASLRLGRPETHGEIHGRIEHSLQLLSQAVAEMAATGANEPPAGMVLEVVRLLTKSADDSGEPIRPQERPAPASAGGAASPAGDVTGGQTASSGDAAVERLNVPASDVDEALRLAASLARGLTSFQDAFQQDGEHAASLQSLAVVAGRLETTIAGLRLLPAEIALSGIESETQQLAKRLGKQAVLVVEGRDVRADRRTLQAARVMIRHLLRNSLDHGIESPERRTAVGKPPAGRITLRVVAIESSLRVDMQDDGGGFDLAAIRAAIARRKGDPGLVERLSDEEVLQIFASEGGSTRATATEVSGRGLGLSAVANMARGVGGTFEVRTERGAGSHIAFTLPLEMYATEVLATRGAGRLLGIPVRSIQRSIHLQAAKDLVQRGPSGITLAVGETLLPLYDLSRLLMGAAPASELPPFAVVVQEEGNLAAFAIEEAGTVMGVVPVTVPGVAAPGALVTGLTQLANGTVLEILNPKRLLEMARTIPRTAASVEAPAPAPAATAGETPLEVVLAEDSLSTREVLRVLLEQHGFRVRLAADGEEALARITERAPDVLVTDLVMPRRDGLWLTRQIRARKELARLPVVLLTSQEDEASQAAGAAAGADAYLVKSRFNATVLTEALARIGVKVRR